MKAPFKLPDFSNMSFSVLGKCECGQDAFMSVSKGISKGVWGEKTLYCEQCYNASLALTAIANQPKVNNHNPQIKVKLLDLAAVNNNTPQDQLEVVFTGTMPECHKYCDQKGFKFQRDCSLFGGYYADFNGPDPDFGNCYLLDL